MRNAAAIQRIKTLLWYDYYEFKFGTFKTLTSHLDHDYFDWSNFGIGRNLLFMLCTGIGFFSILLITEYSVISSFVYTIKSFFTTSLKRDERDEPLDFDVVEEKKRVKTMTESEIENHNLVLMEMSKAYGKFVAVHDMSIAVEQLVCVF